VKISEKFMGCSKMVLEHAFSRFELKQRVSGGCVLKTDLFSRNEKIVYLTS
jgi:hypothetical protein